LDTPEWSEGRKRAFIISTLRAGSKRWPPKWQTLNSAYVGIRLNEKTNREGKHYLCALCEGEFPSKEIHIDHKIPVTGPEGFTTWNDYIERLFCSKENLQAVCVGCHKEKTKEENAIRLHKVRERKNTK
jgi:5-methylcytosine-specific restriction endonuclease McrA